MGQLVINCIELIWLFLDAVGGGFNWGSASNFGWLGATSCERVCVKQMRAYFRFCLLLDWDLFCDLFEFVVNVLGCDAYQTSVYACSKVDRSVCVSLISPSQMKPCWMRPHSMSPQWWQYVGLWKVFLPKLCPCAAGGCSAGPATDAMTPPTTHRSRQIFTVNQHWAHA